MLTLVRVGFGSFFGCVLWVDRSSAIAHCSLQAICSIKGSTVHGPWSMVHGPCCSLLLLSLLSLLPVCLHSTCPGPSSPPSSPPVSLLTFYPFLPPRPLFPHLASLHLVRVFLFLSRSPPICISTTFVNSTSPCAVGLLYSVHILSLSSPLQDIAVQPPSALQQATGHRRVSPLQQRHLVC